MDAGGLERTQLILRRVLVQLVATLVLANQMEEGYAIEEEGGFVEVCQEGVQCLPCVLYPSPLGLTISSQEQRDLR